jgi:hypothetical protein
MPPVYRPVTPAISAIRWPTRSARSESMANMGRLLTRTTRRELAPSRLGVGRHYARARCTFRADSKKEISSLAMGSGSSNGAK